MSASIERADEYIDAAIAISDAVEAGASPSDPAVIELLDSIVVDFGVTVVTGDDSADRILALPEELTYTNGLGGADVLFGRIGTDVIIGGDGDDAIRGRAGDDALFGGVGDDLISGGAGVDFLRGSEGNDVLSGGARGDVLEGGVGDDSLFGGAGHDDLTGGDGVDDLTGGAGLDDFIFLGDAFGVNVEGGTGRIEGDGVRQVVNGADTATDNILDLNFNRDQILFDLEDFQLSGVRFHNAADAAGGTDLTNIGDSNFVVVGSFANAGAAANAIASASDLDEAGVFLYFNSTLGVNRLVYSENLGADDGAGVGTADINVLVALRDVIGDDALALLPHFDADVFGLI